MYLNNRPYYPKQTKNSQKGWLSMAAIAVILVIMAAGGFWWVSRNKSAVTDTTKAPAPSFDKTQFSLTDPTSPWLVVNKKRPLNPKTYAPAGLRTPNINVESSDLQVNDQAATALESMLAAAEQAGVKLILASAYRSYDEQTVIYDSMVRGYGQEEADRQSARPGHSEHQTGWAADLGAANGKCRIEACFAETPEGKWLAANAWRYGFIIRYPDGKESVTGYNYEPWHIRFVDTVLAAEMHRVGTQTLEEFFDLPAASNY